MVDSNVAFKAFWFVVVLLIVLIILMFLYKFDTAGYRRGNPAAASMSLALLLCIALAIFLWPYSTCPECDNRLPHWFDSTCESCGAYLKELPYCPNCNEEVREVVNGCCFNCGTKIVYDRDEDDSTEAE
jgi:hypothetical protein